MSLTEGLAREIGAQVAGLDYSLTGGGNVFEDDFGQEPDLAVMVTSSGGPEPVLGMPDNAQDVQLMFRADPENAAGAEALWWAVFDHLHGLRAKDLPDGTHLVWCIVTQGGPVRIGADENGRQRFAMNARCEVRRP